MFKKLKKKEELGIDSEINLYLNEDYRVKPDREAFIVMLIYGVFGFLWIVLSDKLLDLMISETGLYREIQTYKGWVYVLITMGLIYGLVRNRATLFQKGIMKLKESYEELHSTYEELVATEEELTYQRNFTADIINNASAIIGTWDEKGRIKSMNPFGIELFKYCEEEIIDKEWIELLIPNENKSLMMNVLEQIKKDKQIRNHESQFITKDKRKIDILWNSSMINYSNGSIEFVSVGTDITSQKILQKELENMAYYDYLTVLPNRRFLEDEIKVLIKGKSPFSLVFMDIDNFKYINDTLGHDIGDQLLNFIANRLNQIVKQPNLVVRLSGDEFAILLKGVTVKAEIKKEIELITNYVGKTWKAKNYEFYISFSIGVSRFPEDGASHTTIVRNSNIAMYKAKNTGKKKYLFYTEKFAKDNLQNVNMANELEYATEHGELALYYQPLFDLITGEITGMEALLRWIHPEKGFISPAVFIPLAEETGQIYDIEKWVVKTALLQKKKFEEEGKLDIFISINLSNKTLMSDINFYELEQILKSYILDYSHITMEITETAIIENLDLAIERLQRLKALGIKIALDDFGTGYSSLTYLGKLPIDIVKLDRSFVEKIEENSKDALIIRAFLSLVHDLNYKVVAEGIETNEQLDYLRKYNCDSGQGYLMSRPIPIEEIEIKLKDKLKL